MRGADPVGADLAAALDDAASLPALRAGIQARKVGMASAQTDPQADTTGLRRQVARVEVKSPSTLSTLA